MSGLNNLRPKGVINAFVRTGGVIRRKSSSHVILVKDNNPNILSIPVHKGKPIKKAGLAVEEFLELYR